MRKFWKALLVAAPILAAIPAWGAEPSSGTLAADGDSVSWSGGPFALSNPLTCPTAVDPLCDHFALHIDGQPAHFMVDVSVTTAEPLVDDFNIQVYDPYGELVAITARPGTTGDSIRLFDPYPGTYDVRVMPARVRPQSTYSGTATLSVGSFSIDGGARTQDCDQLPAPKHVALPVVHDDGHEIDLTVLVLVDGADITDAQAQDVVAKISSETYSPIALNVVASYQRVALTGDGRRGPKTAGDGLQMNQRAKAAVGGVRPVGVDVVYTLTNKDLFVVDARGNREYGVAGIADCIGGVRYADRSFATGEFVQGGIAIGPVTFIRDLAARIMGHEIGHVLGAHHHYANCAEGIPADLDGSENSPCTLMAPFAELVSKNFGSVEKIAIRGHTLKYAD